MKIYLLISIIILTVKVLQNYASVCGCKSLRKCYSDMLKTLKDRDEEECVEGSSIGASTVMIFLMAIKKFCPETIEVIEESRSYESRWLYEVIVGIANKDEDVEKNKPVIMIDAGQQAGVNSVGYALFLIEQIVACEENNDMLTRVKWVILPSANPDGTEYSRYNSGRWKKNMKPSDDGMFIGVDISRNFEFQWSNCGPTGSAFDDEYPGPAPNSENETFFIKSVFDRYKPRLGLYLSLRRDGHAILFPYSYSKYNTADEDGHLSKVAAEVAARVNQRAGGVQLFLNESIYEFNGAVRCGSSVDYARNAGVPLAFEMRIFPMQANHIMGMFQTLPRGYVSTLRQGYWSGIHELYIQVKKYHNKKPPANIAGS